MSAEPELVRFDTRSRAIQTDEYSEQIDRRALGIRKHGQLALDELDTSAREASPAERATTQTTRAVLEAKRDQLRRKVSARTEQ